MNRNNNTTIGLDIAKNVFHYAELNRNGRVTGSGMLKRIKVLVSGSEPMRRLMEVPGFGPIVASSFMAAVGDGQAFKCGRVVSAWLGLTPRQHSTGGKSILLGISKRGNRYLRTMLVHGARAVLRTAEAKDKKDPFSRWAREVAKCRGRHKATLAIANKMARIGLGGAG